MYIGFNVLSSLDVVLQLISDFGTDEVIILYEQFKTTSLGDTELEQVLEEWRLFCTLMYKR